MSDSPLFEVRFQLADTILGPEIAMSAAFEAAITDVAARASLAADHTFDNPLVSGLQALGNRYWRHDLEIPQSSDLFAHRVALRGLSMRMLGDALELVSPEYCDDEKQAIDAIGDETFEEIFTSPPSAKIIEAMIASEHTLVQPRKGGLAALALRGVQPWQDKFADVSPTPDDFLDFPFYRGEGRYYQIGPDEMAVHYANARRELNPITKMFSGYPKQVKDLARSAIDTYDDTIASLTPNI